VNPNMGIPSILPSHDLRFGLSFQGGDYEFVVTRRRVNLRLA
jgi:hypothetical protein